MDSTTESLLAYLHQMDVHYVLRREQNGHYSMKIMRDGMLKYESGSGNSAKSAIADAIAQFLTWEQKDFHEYLKGQHGGKQTPDAPTAAAQ